MHRDVIDLVGSCSACDIEIRGELLANSATIKEIILLLGISFHGESSIGVICLQIIVVHSSQSPVPIQLSVSSSSYA